MAQSFVYTSNPARIVFGAGSIRQIAKELRRLGGTRALVLSTPSQHPNAQLLSEQLCTLSAGIYTNAIMHTPVAVTEQAMTIFAACGADCVVSLGGGSTIGLGKAIAYRNNAPQLVVPTTYAGSEVTSVLGQTENRIKTTVSDISILPEVVIYDPELTLSLPVQISITSGLNAMAHAVEGLYALNRNPVTSLMAIEGIRTLKHALPLIVANPIDIQARTDALYGAWLCGSVLGSVGMALHHKLCHTLGGSFNLPHAATHAITLPHTIAYNAIAAAETLTPITKLFGNNIGDGLYDFAVSLGAPIALKDLGLKESELDYAADIVVKNPYWNPRPLERKAIRALLQRSWNGSRPE
ncbi:maleylacetate reductase [Oceanisphaera sediminis]|uniref:Maleylacetate reductase n=1 Tax=Oceanisphaera sediminis TaxID=981381 RepID=A0ABP7E8R4_9GAMM